jgi:hypothetical protein
MGYSTESKMGELLDNPVTKEVLVRHLPEIAKAGPMLNMARGMTLKSLARVAGGKIPPDKLEAIGIELAKM